MTADDRARTDPRVLRTLGLLQEALLALAQEKSFTEITVADVADRATVNRSTFYQHYPDTDTLLADALDMQASQFGVVAGTIDPDAPSDQPPAVLVQYAVLIAEHVDLYRDALGPHGSLVAVNRLQERFRSLAIETMRLNGTTPSRGDLPEEIFAAGVSGTVLSVFAAWVRMDPLPPPETAARWAWSLVAGRSASAATDHRR